jgi:hypothetical protein
LAQNKKSNSQVEDLSSKSDLRKHLDENFAYSVIIPDWLEVKDTGSEYLWGGTLPAINGIENAIIVKIFQKENFTFNDFKKYVVTDLKFGQTPNWSDGSHTFTLKKQLGSYKQFDYRYKIYLTRTENLYHSQFVLFETPKAYIWVDFTATPETYEKNEKKFLEFLDGFQILK